MLKILPYIQYYTFWGKVVNKKTAKVARKCQNNT